ncbi:BLISTER-like isoform X1 [Olea europaea subsp. europaea]|uniref:BLISTER-like isoform X1 n=1 Tax=Olea europaea subsp. europaea TaxID=158383 RepID=A0A8S0TTI6_OLEEU|nr:BLISTER-like isoform X1 [Olea europaea subsp. europaea]
MASAQVLKKQEHLEAGRKKLEEFRRKKAAEKAKKITSASQHDVSNVVLNEKQPLETEFFRPTDFSGAGISDAAGAGGLGSLAIVAKNETKESDIVQKSGFSSSNDTLANSSFLANNDVNLPILAQSNLHGTEFKGDTSHHSTYYEVDKQSNTSEGHKKALSLGNSGTSVVLETDLFPENSISTFLQDKLGYDDRVASNTTSSSYQDVRNSTFGVGQKFPFMGENKFSDPVAIGGSTNNVSTWPKSNGYAGFSSDAQISSNHALPSPPATGRRSRPSFLDSINISRGPSASPPLIVEAKTDSFSSKVYPVGSLGSSVPQDTANSFVASSNGVDLFNHVMENSMENKHDLYSRKQNEDFAALEQHIEDLTQDKFSLQRALEASRTLAESLAAENSTLTDSYNQQGSIVNQLKFDLENLQAEIKAQLTELEAVKIEYTNAQLECNAADDRAKLLASEVIGLEEKALRLRSNELKLERQLENSQAEISSYRRKMSSLEKDRQDLQSTIDALQEEKKLLQSKLRKVSASGKSVDFKKSPSNTKDVSTSTEDLADERDADTTLKALNLDNFCSASLGDDASSSQFLHENGSFNIEDLSSSIPSDQLRMIQNINTLIAELALEKDQVTQAFLAESSQSSKLMELNKELTRKLEAQTQRLELLTAQTMANDNIPARQLDPRIVRDETPFADEGDEVVERVLGWIMKLFPGGPSRRRTSKLL